MGNTINVVIQAQDLTGPGLQSALDQAGQFGQKFKTTLESPIADIGKAMAGAFGIGVGVAGFTEFLKSSADAAMETQDSIVHLKNSVEITGEAYLSAEPQIRKFTESLQEQTRFSAIEGRQALDTLTSLTGNFAIALQLSNAAVDLAAARRMSLSEASELVAKATEGVTQGLRRQGVVFDDTTNQILKMATESERATIIIGKLEEKFGGAAQRDLESYSAQVQKLKNEWHDWMSFFGDTAISGVLGVKKAFGGLFDFLTLYLSTFGQTGIGKVMLPGIDDNTTKAIVAANDKQIAQLREQSAERQKQIALGVLALDQAQRQKVIDDGIAAAKKYDADQAEKAAEADARHYEQNQRAYADLSNGIGQAIARTQELADSRRDLSPYEQELQKIAEQWQQQRDGLEQLIAKAAAFGPAAAPLIAALMDATLQTKEFEAAQQEQYERAYLKKAIDAADQSLTTLAIHLQDVASKLPGFLASDLNAQSSGIVAMTQGAAELIQHMVDVGALLPQDAALMIKQMTEGVVSFGQQLGDQMQQAGQELVASIRESASELGSLFEGFITGGTKGLQSALDGIFQKTTKDFSDLLAAGVLVAFGGTPDRKNYSPGPTGEAFYQTALQNSKTQAAAIASATLTAGAGVVNAIQNGTRETVAQMAVAAVATGYSVALALASTGYGAIAGVIVGLGTFLAGLFSPADTAGKYYEHIDIRNNQVDFNPQPGKDVPGTGYSADQARQIFQSIQKTIDTFTNGWIEVLAKFSNSAALLAQITPLNLNEAQTAWNSAASKGFNDAMNAWISTGLPGMIQDNFWTPFAQGLAGLGLSPAAIAALHDAVNTMVPQDALKFANDLVTALLGINKALAQLSGGAQGDAFGSTGFDAAAYNAVHGSFTDSMSSTISDIEQMGALLGSLSGEAQVQELQQIVDKSNAYYQSVLQYLEKIQAISDQINASIQADLDKYRLAGMKKADGSPDYAAQINYVDKEYNNAIAQLRAAKTPEDVAKWEGIAQGYIDEIMGFASHGSAATQAAFSTWAQNQLTLLGQLSTTLLGSMKTAAEQQAEALAAELAPFVQAFKDATGALEDFAKNLPGGPGPGPGLGPGGKTPGPIIIIPPGSQFPPGDMAYRAPGPITINLTVTPSTDGFQRTITVSRSTQ